MNVSGKIGFDLITVDIDQRIDMQRLVDKEDDQYLGAPATVLLEDQKTMICIYSKGPNKGPVIMRKSYDGGLTWSEKLATPKSWEKSDRSPTVYPLYDKDGKRRLVMFSGGYPPISISISEDDGDSWSELEQIYEHRGHLMAGCTALKEKGHYLATMHYAFHNRMVLQTMKSVDGGATWGEKRDIYFSNIFHTCEAEVLRSPDGNEIALLIRENSRCYNSLIMFSSNEGETWTEPRLLPGSLTGDRHQAVYLPDGRILVEFRDMTPKECPANRVSPTEGDWVGWVGTWEDLKNGYEGQYRIRFKDNYSVCDGACSDIEVLPDGTVVSIASGHWNSFGEPYLLSVRFKIEELDAMYEELKNNGQKIINNNQGECGNFLYDPAQPEKLFKEVDERLFF